MGCHGDYVDRASDLRPALEPRPRAASLPSSTQWSIPWRTLTHPVSPCGQQPVQARSRSRDEGLRRKGRGRDRRRKRHRVAPWLDRFAAEGMKIVLADIEQAALTGPRPRYAPAGATVTRSAPTSARRRCGGASEVRRRHVRRRAYPVQQCRGRHGRHIPADDREGLGVDDRRQPLGASSTASGRSSPS